MPSSSVTSMVPTVADTPLVVVATIGVVVTTVDCEAETVRFPKVTLALNGDEGEIVLGRVRCRVGDASPCRRTR